MTRSSLVQPWLFQLIKCKRLSGNCLRPLLGGAQTAQHTTAAAAAAAVVREATAAAMADHPQLEGASEEERVHKLAAAKEERMRKVIRCALVWGWLNFWLRQAGRSGTVDDIEYVVSLTLLRRPGQRAGGAGEQQRREQ